MKQSAIYIDFKNLDQVKWWNEIGSGLVKTLRYNTIVEAAMDEPVGVIFTIEGLFREYVVKKSLEFISDSASAVMGERL